MEHAAGVDLKQDTNIEQIASHLVLPERRLFDLFLQLSIWKLEVLPCLNMNLWSVFISVGAL